MIQEQMSGDSVLRERAIKQLKKQRDFQTHLLVYALVNGMLVGIWAISSSDGFFWPLFSIVGGASVWSSTDGTRTSVANPTRPTSSG